MTAPETTAPEEEIGRCYTKARRCPLMIGTFPDRDGRRYRMPGGPYSITQLGTLVGTVVLLLVTRPLWGGHGVVDATVMVTLPFAAAFALRHLHIDGRNPLAAAASAAALLAAPRQGRLQGRAWRPARPSRTHGRITLTPTPELEGELAPAATPEAAPAPAPALATAAAPTPAPGRTPTPAPAASAAPVASGVQALLAHRP